MKKNNYKTDFEESKKEIDLNKEKTLTRTELHSKANQPQNMSAHRWPTILFYLFMLIPVCILVMFIYNWSAGASKGEVVTKDKAEESHFQFETNKNKPEKRVEPADEEEEIESDQVKKEKEGKEKKAEAEREKKAQAEKEKKVEAERVKKEKEEQEKLAEAERVKKEQEEQARQAEADRVKKEQEEQARKAEAERVKKEQAKQEQDKPASRTHTVAAGETLYRIAVNNYGSGDAVSKIKQANGLSSNEISVGQTLVLP